MPNANCWPWLKFTLLRGKLSATELSKLREEQSKGTVEMFWFTYMQTCTEATFTATWVEGTFFVFTYFMSSLQICLCQTYESYYKFEVIAYEGTNTSETIWINSYSPYTQNCFHRVISYSQQWFSLRLAYECWASNFCYQTAYYQLRW